MAFSKSEGDPARSGGAFPATEKIYDFLSGNQINCAVRVTDQSSIVETSFKSQHGGSIRLVFISRDRDNDVAVRAWNVVPVVPEARQQEVLWLVNELNSRFRFAKFVLDRDSSVSVQYDMPLNTSAVGETAMECLVRMAKVIDEAYPELMKALRP